MALRARKVSGAFEKRPPGVHGVTFLVQDLEIFRIQHRTPILSNKIFE